MSEIKSRDWHVEVDEKTDPGEIAIWVVDADGHIIASDFSLSYRLHWHEDFEPEDGIRDDLLERMRLIAAAPEMLAALKAIVDSEFCCDAIPRHYIEPARAAIASAEQEGRE